MTFITPIISDLLSPGWSISFSLSLSVGSLVYHLRSYSVPSIRLSNVVVVVVAGQLPSGCLIAQFHLLVYFLSANWSQ